MNISSLPRLSVLDAKNLPEVPCVYFVVNDAGDLLYVGSSINLRHRWVSHHRADQTRQEKAHIAWMVANEDQIREEEERFIQSLNPLWNDRTANDISGLPPTQRAYPQSTRTNIYIPDELLERMRAVAQGRTIAAMVREALILWLKTQEKP